MSGAFENCPEKYESNENFQQAVSNCIENLDVRTKRGIFTHIRDPATDENAFFPKQGITAAEFAVHQVLTHRSR